MAGLIAALAGEGASATVYQLQGQGTVNRLYHFIFGSRGLDQEQAGVVALGDAIRVTATFDTALAVPTSGPGPTSTTYSVPTVMTMTMGGYSSTFPTMAIVLRNEYQPAGGGALFDSETFVASNSPTIRPDPFGFNSSLAGTESVVLTATDSTRTALQSTLIDGLAPTTSFTGLSLSYSFNLYHPILEGDVEGITVFTNNVSMSLVALPAPEPATWAMMVAGFGLVGAAMRRQRVARYA
jgi:hypothetical protein